MLWPHFREELEVLTNIKRFSEEDDMNIRSYLLLSTYYIGATVLSVMCTLFYCF